MKKQCAGLFAAIFPFLLISPLLSQDEANKAIRDYKEKVSGANKAYADSVEGAREKKRQEIAAATGAALKALKDELAKTGPGDVARAIALAKRIYQLDSADKEARKILLAANIDLNSLEPSGANSAPPPAKPKEAPAPQKAPVKPQVPPTAAPPVAEPAPTPPMPTEPPSEFGVFGGNSVGAGANYPIQRNKRPLTLPEGASARVFGIGSQEMVYFSDWDEAWVEDVTLLTFETAYGISDKLQLGARSGLGFSSPLTDILPIDLFGKFSLYQTEFESGNLSMATSAYIPINISDIGWGDPNETIPFVSLGLPTRWNFADDAVSLHFGHGLLTLGSDDTVANFNIGLNFQVSDNFNLGISSRLFDIGGNYSERPVNFVASYSMTPASEFVLFYQDNAFSTILLGLVFRSL
ncbi:MAG: hypothetical protein VYB34_03145 [Planctomycetota bacterium]|nr:hypothetical protein [Planctomycetota bacterium]